MVEASPPADVDGGQGGGQAHGQPGQEDGRAGGQGGAERPELGLELAGRQGDEDGGGVVEGDHQPLAPGVQGQGAHGGLLQLGREDAGETWHRGSARGCRGCSLPRDIP